MTLRSTLLPVAGALCLLSASAVPASAYEVTVTAKPFETLLREGYRTVATMTAAGEALPGLLLAKEGSVDVYLCAYRVRDCARLTDSPNNTPPGFGAPSSSRP